MESALGAAHTAVADLLDADVSVLGSSLLVDSFDDLVRLRRATEAAYLRLLGEVDDRKIATDVGAKSTAEWLRLRHNQVGSVRDVGAARAIGPDGDLREMGAALADGRISREHLDVAVRCLARIPAHLKDEQRGKLAQFLTEQSEQFAPRDFEDVANALLGVLDPDGSRTFDPDAHQRRSLTKAEDATGMLAGRFLLDQIGSAWFTAALAPLRRPRPGRLRRRRARPTDPPGQGHPQQRAALRRRAGADGQGSAGQRRRTRRRTTPHRHAHQARPTRRRRPHQKRPTQWGRRQRHRQA